VPTRRKRLLVVEDDDGVREALFAALSDTYAVITATDGREALDLLASHRFDAVLLDLMLPRLDGRGVMKEMKARGLRIPTVLASAGREMRQVAREVGAEDWIEKPFDLGELESKLAKVTGRRARGKPRSEKPPPNASR